MNYSQKSIRLAALTLITVGAIAGAVAADVSTGKGGATELMKPLSPKSSQPRAVMSCPMCKSTYTTRKDLSARGTIKPVSIVENHACPGCTTTLTTIGAGKAKSNVAVHQCTMNAQKDLTCCASK